MFCVLQVSLHNKEAVVQYEPLVTQPEQLAEHIDNMGFSAKVKPAGGYKDAVIHIDGMTCMSCVRNIQGNIGVKDGVKFIQVSLDKKLGYVKFDPDKTSAGDVCEAIEDMGFDASLSPMEAAAGSINATPVINEPLVASVTHIIIEGMTCQSCVKNITQNISGKPGVRHITVSLEKKQAEVHYNPQETNPETLREEIDDMGFDATLPSAAMSSDDEEFAKLAQRNTVDTCFVSVEGMTCMSCVRNIEGNISSVAGIRSIKVSLEEKRAIVQFEPSKLTSEEIAEKIDDMGFDAKVIPTPSAVQPSASSSSGSRLGAGRPDTLSVCVDVKGMTCQSCVKTIEGAVGEQAGVESVRVSLADQRADIVYDPALVSPTQLRDRIDDLGFDATLKGTISHRC